MHQDSQDLIRKDIETFDHIFSTDLHEKRSLELIELGDFVAAERIRKCGAVGAGCQIRYCHRRDCPTCASYLAKRYRTQLLEGTRSFQGEVVLVGLFALTSELHLLDNAFRRWRRAQNLVRRRVAMRRVVLGGCGALEPKLTLNRTRWNLHAHVLLDATGLAIPEIEIREQWRALTGGAFSLDPHHRTVRSKAAFSKYATKTATWAPDPGQLTADEYAHLRKGIRGKQLIVRWGTGCPGSTR